jgi:hypothetical protein
LQCVGPTVSDDVVALFLADAFAFKRVVSIFVMEGSTFAYWWVIVENWKAEFTLEC